MTTSAGIRPQQPVLYDVHDVAKIMGVSESTIRRWWVRWGLMPPSQIPFDHHGRIRRLWTIRQLNERFK